MFNSRLLVIWCFLGIAACSTQRATDTGAGGRNPDLLVGTELHSQSGITLYDQIRRARPRWLSTRGINSPNQANDGIVVYHNGVRLGGVANLRDFIVDAVESVQFLSGPEAASRFGLDHQYGAILVTTRR